MLHILSESLLCSATGQGLLRNPSPIQYFHSGTRIRFLWLLNPPHSRLPRTQDLVEKASPFPTARSSWCMYVELSPGAQATLLHFALTHISKSSQTAHQCDNGNAEEHQGHDMCRLF